jgi:hypothetical protein
MATGQQSADAPREATREDESLQPFHGVLTPGICFASGHCVMVLSFSSTPTRIDAYDEVWVFTPDRERRLYTDPPEAGPYVETYHDFDRTLGATITWAQANEDRIAFALEGEDGTTLDLDVDLGSTTATRLLNTVTDLTPQSLLRTSIGQTVSTLGFNELFDANGMKIAGETETQEPYRIEADSLRAVTDATATLNSEDIGAVQPPDRPISFGDAKVPDDPIFSFGDLYLRPPPE